MRIHRLTVAAFGPFADEVDLDVDDLTDSGLFLVHGPTGAGKTSLLDAICFALYAGVPGARDRGPAATLRSHHAAEGAVPRVVLDFTAAGRRLRITRSPAWTRSGRATPVPATVSVEELRSGRWEPAGARHDEVGDIVKDVMGMDRDQFAKVVLLPQGEFAAFLRAGAEDRRKVLERLFDVSTYTGVETWLVERRRSLGALAQAARADAERLRSELLELLARTPVDDEDPGGSGGVQPDPSGHTHAPTDAELATVVVERLTRRLDALLVASDAAELEQRRAGDHWVAVRERATARERGRRAVADRVALDASAEEVTLLRRRQDGAERAAVVRGDLSAVDRARRLVEAAEASVTAAVQALGADDCALRRPSDWGGEASVLLEAVMAQDATVAEVEERRAEVERLGRRRTALAADSDRKAAAVAEARHRAAEVSELLERLAAERAPAAAAAAGLDRADADLVELSRRHRLRVELDRAALGRAGAEDALRRATDAEQGARDVVLDLRERRISGMAAELAAALDDGPCPVCGSTEHPRPARPSHEPVSTSIVRDAEARHDRLLTDRQRASGAVDSIVAREATLREEIGSDQRSAAELAAARARATERRDSAVAAAGRVADLEARATVLGHELAEVSRSLDAATHAVTATTSALAIVDQQLVECTDRGERARATHDAACPCAEVARHAEARDRLQAVVSAERVRVARVGDLDEALAALGRALEATGFPDETSARGAALGADDLRTLQRRLREHDDASVRVAATLEDPEVLAALEARDEQVDVEAASAAKQSADAAVRRISQALGQARTDHTSGSRLVDAYRAALRTLAPLEAELVVVTEVADAASGAGANTRRMPLSAYVLAARLERVAALASERLAVMGEGRFELRHTDDRAGNAKAGLGLEVVDLWTGQARPTSTLSGGESFMASLALALALADAVREEAGGLDLQTLFIDEGFGTLDDESLEQVLGVLDSLRDGGRVVGVVSHVADLRTRIPRQVRVRKAPHGSSIEVRGASAAARSA